MFIIIAGLIMSWGPVPTNEFIEGTCIEYSTAGGAEYSLLVSVPFPDSSAVLPDPPLGIRTRYRGYYFSSGGPGPRGRVLSALLLDWTTGSEGLTGYIIRYQGAEDQDALFILIREPSKWEVSWILTPDSEVVYCECEWDLNSDGYINLSDLSFFGEDYGTNFDPETSARTRAWDLSDFSSLGAVYDSPGYFHYFKGA